MSWKGRGNEAAFTSDVEVPLATFGGGAVTSTKLLGLIWKNDTATDLDMLIRHKKAGVYSGGVQQRVPSGESFKSEFPPLEMDASDESIVATFGAGQVGTMRFHASMVDFTP